jgi:hypothetical protein
MSAAEIYHHVKAKNPNISNRKAKAMAGYSINSHPPVVLESIEKERDKAIKATGYTITKALTKLTEIVDNTEEPMPVIHAIRTANAMLPGYVAPQDIQIKQRTLIMELNSLSHSDIVNLTDALKCESE